MTKRLLIIEDEADLADNLVEFFRSLDWVADVAETLDAALSRLADDGYAAVLTDLRLPGRSGIEIFDEMTRMGRAWPIVVMSAYLDAESLARATAGGAVRILAKPFSLEQLAEVVAALR